MILGIDEVGRGPWAGPLVVGAVVLTDESIASLQAAGLTDSKQLSKKRRESLATLVRGVASGIGVGWVAADELDRIGLSPALRLATRRAVEQITTPYHQIIIDGTVNFLDGTSKAAYVRTLKKADLLIPSVSAAAIIAKVARDNYMAQQDAVYPEFGFTSHVGYGTAMHRAAIEKHGVTPLHRLSYAPLATYRTGESTTKQVGDVAEEVVADRLAHDGHTVIARNWRTKWCEIDIVSQKTGTLYFTEVKYRRTAWQGGGMEAVTASKRRQMQFAAELFLASYPLDTQAVLMAAEVTGEDFIVTQLLELE